MELQGLIDATEKAVSGIGATLSIYIAFRVGRELLHIIKTIGEM